MRRNTQAADPLTACHRYGFFNWPGGGVVVVVVTVVAVDVVGFVRPCATVRFPWFVRVVVVVVLVWPGAVVLFPRAVPAAGVVFVWPGATGLCPRDLAPAGDLVLPGAVALFPGEAARRVALGALALKTAAGTAGRRSDGDGWRGLGTFASTGGP